MKVAVPLPGCYKPSELSKAPRKRLISPAALVCMLTSLPAVCSGCASGRVNLWPIYFHEVRQLDTPEGSRRVTSTDFLYPLFTRESYPGGNWHALRPLYNYEHRDQPGVYRVQYLWPLGLHNRDGSEVHHRLFPLFAYNKTRSESQGEYALHAHLLQILRWGYQPPWGAYFCFFPIGGVTHGVIGRTWSFALFPLFSHYRRADYSRYDFPWPFIGFGRTPDGREQQYRLWPLYVYQRQETGAGTYQRQDLLWPLARWGTLDRGGRYYHRVFALTPLLSTVRTYDRQDHLVAHQTSVLGVSFSSDKREEQEPPGWSILWSLVRSTKGPKTEEVRIFPFYWSTTHYKTAEKKPEESWTRRRILWPIVWLDSDRMSEPGVDHRGILVVPFYWHYTDVAATESTRTLKERRITLFPLFTVQQDRDGSSHFWVLSHGWRDESQGYKRNYRAFFDLFQYHHAADGESETRLLWRLFHRRSGPRGTYMSFGPLFTYDSTGEVVGEDGSYFSCLFELLKCSWTATGTRWRVLFIPFGG